MAQITNAPNPDLSVMLGLNDRTKATKLAKKLEQLIAARHKAESLENQLKADLKETLKSAYFGYNVDVRNASEVEHTFDVAGLQVNFVNAYFIKDTEHAQTIAKLLGAGHPLINHIKESQKITVDVTNLSSLEANSLAGSIASKSAEYGIRPQVERRTVTTPEFHSYRHVVLSEEDNQALDEVLPLPIQVALIK